MEGNRMMIPGGGSFALQGSTPVNHNPMPDSVKPGLGRNSGSEEDDAGNGKRTPVWQRVKWTDVMVKILITALSYIDEDVVSNSGRRRCWSQHKKGKWRTVSKVMSEREWSVSPQQCEDKFNDLNKRYKKLNEILGRGTSCQVVENPALLDIMGHLSDKAKDEVRKILSSRQLFYEAMCSYLNANRLNLPHDQSLQRSVQMALGSRDDHESDEDERDSGKRMRQGKGQEEFHLGLQSQKQPDLALVKLRIEMERVELQKEWFEWNEFSREEDRELEKLKAENERMRLENEQMALRLKKMEMRIASE